MVAESNSGSYMLRLHCHNCGNVDDYEIEKGMRVVSVPCENCGVKQLKRVEYAVFHDIEDKLKDELREEMGLGE